MVVTMFEFVTEDVEEAVREAEEFEAQSEYGNLICLKVVSGGVNQETFDTSINNIKKYLSAEDSSFFSRFFLEKSVNNFCCLPSGHSGRCSGSYEKFFAPQFANKLKDCATTPGDDDILFKNRARRTFPIQVTKARYRELNEKHRWKGSNLKLKAAVPLEHAGTPFTVATAQFDFAALLLLQKGVDQWLPQDVELALKKRSLDIVNKLRQDRIFITNSSGYLCDAIVGCTLEPEWYSIKNGSDPNQIQFGHIRPITSNQYMTRGMNVIPITRRGNIIQSDNPLNEVHLFIKEAYEHLNQR